MKSKKKSSKSVKKKSVNEPRLFWNGFIWVNEEDLTEEGKMRYRLGDLYPENLN